MAIIESELAGNSSTLGRRRSRKERLTQIEPLDRIERIPPSEQLKKFSLLL